jgi:hypothetical protein
VAKRLEKQASGCGSTSLVGRGASKTAHQAGFPRHRKSFSATHFGAVIDNLKTVCVVKLLF